MLLAHETWEGSLSDVLVGRMYLISSSMPPPDQESATLAGAITYKQTKPSVLQKLVPSYCKSPVTLHPRERKLTMINLISFVALIALSAILACGGDDVTESPTNTSIPPTVPPTATAPLTATPKPTATPMPTVTPKPTTSRVATEVPEATVVPSVSTQTPEEETKDAQIAPLSLENPAAIMAELTQDELACAASVARTDRLLQIFAAPELASPEERSALLGCFSDETLMRFFLTGLIGQSGPLSVESSACVRAGMEGIDLRSLMTAEQESDQQAAMVDSMSAMVLTLSCLNDEEFSAARSALGMTPEDRENLECVLDKLGGPEGMATVIGSGDEVAFVEFLSIAIGCGLQLEGAPVP